MKRTAGSSSRQERERVREERNEEAEDLMVRSQRRFAEYQRARKELKLSHADALRHAADAVEAVNVKPFERPLPPAAKRPKRSPAVPSMRSKCPLCTVVVPARSKDGLDEHVSMCLEARDKLMQLGFDEQQVKAALKAGNTRACASYLASLRDPATPADGGALPQSFAVPSIEVLVSCIVEVPT
ncbi:hypothetical protein DIPPA_30961 [Diplonema papillatum]|nr:hypothetical protein DIPPA_30961 [Diplonema papillatum]